MSQSIEWIEADLRPQLPAERGPAPLNPPRRASCLAQGCRNLCVFAMSEQSASYVLACVYTYIDIVQQIYFNTMYYAARKPGVAGSQV